ncbi:WD40 domain-containing protein [Encephalitozoon intestinalis ATCC 50506]|uniref:WD40 domain-containing protein n=1 Tax=Encephalitozoon intestinalis (strain ATCC 50506) TaxID=876142 RepID=E0S826_ENCIT|nr:WD40 domain-containing protein [Encephalitozoon intestinalis ATCC 50506]ADM11861.1 WD40 domain-containing protein [Encephalitozoon intestinalis ATCC 50506]UTX45616.1 WD40 domain-containing protein [Encephalitozoon intestinalis]
MDGRHEMSEEEYKRLRKSQPKKKKVPREDFGDPSEIGGFKGPWSRFVGICEDTKTPRDVKEEYSLKKIVNKHCLTAGKERSRSSYFLSMKDPSLGRVPSKKFLVPKSNVMLFHDHKDMVSSAILFRKHKLFLSSGFDGKAYLYNLKDRELVTTYMGHSKGVSSAIVSECESKFSTVSFDGFLKGWDVETGRCNTKVDLDCPLTCQTSEALDKAIFVGGIDGRVRTVDMRSRAVLDAMIEERISEKDAFKTFSIRDILTINDSSLVFTRREGSLHYLDLRNNQIVKSLRNSYSFVGFSHGKNAIMATGQDEIVLLDAHTLEKKEEEIKAPECSTPAKASEDGGILCYGSSKGLVSFFTSKSTASFGSAGEMITAVDWIDGSSSSFISGDILGNVKIWE